MAYKLRSILVKRMTYTRIYNATPFLQYIRYSILNGSTAVLYHDPHIPNAFYDEGTAIADKLELVMRNLGSNPSKGRLKIVKNLIISGKRWLHDYADSVEKIANDATNRDTLEEAVANIFISYLTPRKIGKARKKLPPRPIITATYLSSGRVDVKIQNKAGYNPMMTIFIVIEKALNAKVSIVDGELVIVMDGKGQVRSQTANGKGRIVHFTGLKASVAYEIYAYAQNGNKMCSRLSQVCNVHG